ncbi:unnamed protein product [Amaranthus hypochondriacus]
MAAEGQEMMAAKVSQRKKYRCLHDWSNLPSELLVDILIRLSDKEMVRCKTICKSWNDIIVNFCIPKLFASAPLSKLICEMTCAIDLVVAHVPDGPYAINGEMVSSSEGLSRVFPVPKRIPFIGCWNGLFLFVRMGRRTLEVWNPATGQSIEIPACIEVIARCQVSLAFDPCRSPHFKVVCFCSLSRWFKLHIYSSETGRWDVHKILSDGDDCEHEWCDRTVYANGILYTLSEPDHLLCVDVDHLKVCYIKLPFNIRKNVIGFIGVSRNRLCYSNRDFYYMFVWRLEGSLDAPKWVLMHKIHIKWLISNACVNYRTSKYFMPYAFDPNSDVIFIGTPNSIFAYDPHGRKVIGTHWVEESHKDLVNGQETVYPYVRCLLSLKSHEQKPCASLISSKYVKYTTLVDKLDEGLIAADCTVWNRKVKLYLKRSKENELHRLPKDFLKFKWSYSCTYKPRSRLSGRFVSISSLKSSHIP